MKKTSLIIALLLALACLISALAEPMADYVFPSPVAIQDKSEVIGKWTMSGAGLGDMFYTAETLGLAGNLEITENVIRFNVNGNDFVCESWEILEDGTIQYTDPDGTTDIFVYNDDGTLSSVASTEAEGLTISITMYFARVPEA